MEVYHFEKCLLERMEESMSVLSWSEKAIPAAEVRNEWNYYIELQIEPAGWQSLWKIPRVICEEIGLRYPTVVFGRVEQVLFKELKAIFKILAVQDDDVRIQEKHEVALEDLYPTKSQENDALNVELTADCLDRLRFFYTHVWMPWDNDNDDDLNWVEKHLESRIRFFYDLRKGTIKKSLAAHIRTLIAEARYIQSRREYLELGLSDDEELDDTLNKSEITDLMRMHLRLTMIRSEIEMFENPELRRIYEEMHFDEHNHLKLVGSGGAAGAKSAPLKKSFYIVTSMCPLARQIELVKLAEKLIPKEAPVQMCPSLQDALGICASSDSIFLTPGRHTIKFLEYLNDNGSIVGLQDAGAQDVQDVILTSPDNDSILLVFDGSFTLSNLVLDCSNVRTGIVVKRGELTLRDCRIMGDGKTSTQEGIVCSAGAKVKFENCIVEKFATGIKLKGAAEIGMDHSKISDCRVGIDANDEAIVHFEDSTISHSKRTGILVDAMSLDNVQKKLVILTDIDDVKDHINPKLPAPKWTGKCSFDECLSNLFIKNEQRALVQSKTLQCIYDDNNDIQYPDDSDITVE